MIVSKDSNPADFIGTLLVPTVVLRDQRGYFLESWHREKAQKLGLDADFVQDNVSHSRQGVLRGLHFQWPEPQGKLVHVLHGRIFDVAVDVRRDSPTFGRWCGVELDADHQRQFFIPEGYAHGFCVLSEVALVLYKCTRAYDSAGDQCLAWNDPDLGIEWPVSSPLLSDKDAAAPCLREFCADELPCGLNAPEAADCSLYAPAARPTP